MPEIDDIWDDEEDRQQFVRRTASPARQSKIVAAREVTATTLNTQVTGRDDWTTATFEANTTKGAIPVTGMVCGFFGIHRTDAKGMFHLTHLPTGCCVGRADEGHRLVLVAARFREAADWSFSDLNGIVQQGVADKLRAILRSHNAIMAAQVDEAEAA